MFAKKKQTSVVPPEPLQTKTTTSQIQFSARRPHQKHSRKHTAQTSILNIQTLLNKNFVNSARESAQRNLLYNMDNLFFGYRTSFTLSIEQACRSSYSKEILINYYVLSKHQDSGVQSQKFIQNSLSEAIQARNQYEFMSKSIIHYEPHIFGIMRQHLARRRSFVRKMLTHQTSSSISRGPKTWVKQLPTLVSSNDRGESDIKLDIKAKRGRLDSKKLNTSESFQLKNLAQCIKEMFYKQGIYDKVKEQEWSKRRISGQSWLQERPTDQKPIMDCDFSSIQMNSKFDLMVESRLKIKGQFNVDAEENYGLGQLKRRYEEQRLSKFRNSGNSSKKSGFGHKRNPTDALHNRGDQQYEYEPMTPKQHYAGSHSIFGSSKNIAINSPKNQEKVKKSNSKKKDFGINEAYLLKFDKEKQRKKQVTHKVPISQMKQNFNRESVRSHSKSKNQPKNKSKSKEKQLKSGMMKAQLRKL